MSKVLIVLNTLAPGNLTNSVFQYCYCLAQQCQYELIDRLLDLKYRAVNSKNFIQSLKSWDILGVGGREIQAQKQTFITEVNK